MDARTSTALGALAAAALLSIVARADVQSEPFALYDQSPVVQIYGLPALGSARLLEPGQLQVGLHLQVANHFYNTATNGELLVLDGETRRGSFLVKQTRGRVEWGIEVPYASHSGGTLDGFIENWHSTFGMPNGGREQLPRDQLTYLYQRNGIDRFRFTQPSNGIGDVRLLAGWPIGSSATTDTVFRTTLKLPTGESSEFLGSGATDIAAWLVSGCKPSACAGALHWTLAGGLLGVGRGDVLPEQQRRIVGFAGANLSYPAYEGWTLKAELLGHTPFYKDSSLKPLDANAIQLVLGVGWEVTVQTVVEVAVAEDISVDTSPDVTFLLSVRSNFR